MIMDFLSNINESFNEQKGLTIEYIEAFLKNIIVNKTDVEPYLIEPDHLPYGRCTLFKNEEVEVCVLHWIIGSKSSIHDHANSDCSMLVIEGNLLNRNFDLNENNELIPLSTLTNHPNDVVTVSKTNIHELEQVGSDVAITLHIYYPPLQNIKIF
jgi:cysteine dioxygenase